MTARGLKTEKKGRKALKTEEQEDEWRKEGK